MREVEIRFRDLAGAGNDDLGVALMKEAFKKGGPLTDPALDAGEQQATMALFWGAIGVFKNPSSHRKVDYEDPTLASEIITNNRTLLTIGSPDQACDGNRINLSILVQGNNAGSEISDNDVGGNLTCRRNVPPPVGGGNRVEGNKEGQCRAL